MGSIAPPQQNGDYKKPRRVYLLTSPRTASNLFVRILNVYNQPNVTTSQKFGGYFFMPGLQARDNLNKWNVPVDQLPEEEKKAVQGAIQGGLDTYREVLETAEKENNIAFVKEHVILMMKPALEMELGHGVPSDSVPPHSYHYDEATDVYTPANPTLVPDNILETFLPTILIRHPAIQLPSMYRFQLEARDERVGDSGAVYAKIFNNLIAVRQIYDFYISKLHSSDSPTEWPLIIDAADFITHPATIMKYFCDETGLDFASCKFNWDVVTKDMMGPMAHDKMAVRALSTINASTGIDPKKAMADVDIDTEAAKWKAEFGDAMGAQLEREVRAMMPDYEFLRDRRLTPQLAEQRLEKREKVHTDNEPVRGSGAVAA